MRHMGRITQEPQGYYPPHARSVPAHRSAQAPGLRRHTGRNGVLPASRCFEGQGTPEFS